MPRNQQSHSNTSTQISVRTDETLKKAYKGALKDEGRSMSEDMREHMEAVVREHGGGPGEDHLPDGQRLRDAYLTLHDLADERVPGAGLRLTREEARNWLHGQRTPKDSVMDEIVRPLVKQGFARVDPAMDQVWIVIRALEDEFEQPSAQTSEQPAVQEASD